MLDLRDFSQEITGARCSVSITFLNDQTNSADSFRVMRSAAKVDEWRISIDFDESAGRLFRSKPT